MLSKQEVERIAKLARLELTESEIERMQKELSSILDYVDILKKAKIKSKNNTAKLKLVKNVLREDRVELRSSSLANNLIAQAPDNKEGYIKVKAIL